MLACGMQVHFARILEEADVAGHSVCYTAWLVREQCVLCGEPQQQPVVHVHAWAGNLEKNIHWCLGNGRTFGLHVQLVLGCCMLLMRWFMSGTTLAAFHCMTGLIALWLCAVVGCLDGEHDWMVVWWPPYFCCCW